MGLLLLEILFLGLKLGEGGYFCIGGLAFGRNFVSVKMYLKLEILKIQVRLELLYRKTYEKKELAV